MKIVGVLLNDLRRKAMALVVRAGGRLRAARGGWWVLVGALALVVVMAIVGSYDLTPGPRVVVDESDSQAQSPETKAQLAVGEPSGQTEAEPFDPAEIVWPLDGEEVRDYGFVFDEDFGDYRFHPGIDLTAPLNTEVVAVAAGTVIKEGTSLRDGYWLMLDHGQGWTSYYSQLGGLRVAQGDQLAKGQVIGRLDAPGTAEPGQPHLHFELRQHGQAVNPHTYQAQN